MRKVKAPGYRILVRLKPIERKKEVYSEGGIITAIEDPTDWELKQKAVTEGWVLDIGPWAFKEGKPWVKIGDCVQVYKYSGVPVYLDDEYSYSMIQDLDIQAVFPGEELQ